MATATMTRFADWLETEMRMRGINKSQLAAYLDTSGSTVGAWFNDDRLPSTAMCRELARVLHVPVEQVLQLAEHLSEGPIPAQELPGWLTAVLEKLSLDELRVVDATARGLLRVREEPSTYEPGEPASPEEPGS